MRFAYGFLIAVLLVATRSVLSIPEDMRIAPGLLEETIQVSGDLMIGMLMSITGDESGNWKGRCEGPLSLERIELTQLTLQLLDEFNTNLTSLGNRRLGMSVYDFCGREILAAAQVLHFFNLSGSEKAPYIVVICCATSQVTTYVSPLTSAYQIPHISPLTTSDALSDKTIHEYFMRTFTPNRLLAKALVDFIVHFNWSYVVVLYGNGTFGEDLMHQFESLAKNLTRPICIAYSKSISSLVTKQEMAVVLNQILHIDDARVVLLLIYNPQIELLLTDIRNRGITNRYIWIGTAPWNGISVDLQTMGQASFTLEQTAQIHPELFKFLHDPALALDPRNPWIVKYWETRFNCVINTTCNMTNLTSSNQAPTTARGVFWNDALLTIVTALQRYLPTIDYDVNRFSQKVFLTFMKNVSTMGMNGFISFDTNGDLMGTFYIMQHIKDQYGYRVAEVGSWSARMSSLQFNGIPITWSGNGTGVPESVCSKPCPEGSILIQREFICCWDCIPCRKNELPNRNLSKCIECPVFQWPNDDLTNCSLVDPSYLEYGEPMGIAVTTIALIGFGLAIVTIVVFIKHREHQLVKSSCREASFIMLGGLCGSFLQIFLLIGKPSNATCALFRVLFHTLCSSVFGSIAVKAIKIWRIFDAAKRSAQAPKMISEMVQLLAIAGMMTVEGVFILASWLIRPPAMELLMPLKYEPFVEITCNESLMSLCIGLAFNLVLMLACAVMAIRTRKLPDSFKESSQIAVSVSVSLITSTIFLSLYGTTSAASQKRLLMLLIVVVNGFVTLGGIFFPKLVVLYFGQGGSTVQATLNHSTGNQSSAQMRWKPSG